MDNRILGKYLFNEASPQEQAEVEQWLATNPAHREELELLRRRITLAVRNYRQGAFDPGAALARVTRKRPALSIRTLSGIAAAVLLLIGSFLFLYTPATTSYRCLAGEIRSIYLPDSSRVTLSGPASLEVSRRFDKENRAVTALGTLFFEVARHPEKPFVVHTPSMEVTVLGTSFQVEASGDSTQVMVSRGRVQTTAPGRKEGLILTAGMAAGNSLSRPTPASAVYEVNQISWKTGYFRFDNTPLPEVIRLLNRHYRATVTCPPASAGLRITVTLDQLSLEEALSIINETLGTQLMPGLLKN